MHDHCPIFPKVDFEIAVVMVRERLEQSHASWSQGCPPEEKLLVCHECKSAETPCEHRKVQNAKKLHEWFMTTVVVGMDDTADGLYCPNTGEAQLPWQQWSGRDASARLRDGMWAGFAYQWVAEPVTGKSNRDLKKVNGTSVVTGGYRGEGVEPQSAAAEFRRVAVEGGKWEGPLSYPPETLTPMHYVSKVRDDDSVKWRLVTDAKTSGHNAACVKSTATYPSVNDAIALMSRNSVTVKVDEVDAFLGKPRRAVERDCVSVVSPGTEDCFHHCYLVFGTTCGPEIQMDCSSDVIRMRRDGWGDQPMELGPAATKWLPEGEVPQEVGSANGVVMMDDYHASVRVKDITDTTYPEGWYEYDQIAGLLARLGIASQKEAGKSDVGVGLSFKGIVLDQVADTASVPPLKMGSICRQMRKLMAEVRANGG